MRGYAAIGLYQPKYSVNIGSVLRACACYGVSLLAYTGCRFERSKAPTDTSKWYRHMPMQHVDDLFNVIPYDCIPVAVEIREDAISLFDYKHPPRAFYVFGPEDGTLGHQVTRWCKDTVYVPTSYCMNLAATVNVVLYDRMSKGVRNA